MLKEVWVCRFLQNVVSLALKLDAMGRLTFKYRPFRLRGKREKCDDGVGGANKEGGARYVVGKRHQRQMRHCYRYVTHITKVPLLSM